MPTIGYGEDGLTFQTLRAHRRDLGVSMKLAQTGWD